MTAAPGGLTAFPASRSFPNSSRIAGTRQYRCRQVERAGRSASDAPRRYGNAALKRDSARRHAEAVPP